jgi:hypothetical protein
VPTTQPFSAPNADRYRDIADNPNGGNATNAQWNQAAAAWKNVLPGQSINDYRQGNPGAIQNLNVSPASGNYNPDNVRVQRDQDAYWGAQRMLANAQSPYERNMALTALNNLRANDVALRGQDVTQYGYNQSRGTEQDRIAGLQRLQETNPTLPANAYDALARGALNTSQAQGLDLSNQYTQSLNALKQRIMSDSNPKTREEGLAHLQQLIYASMPPVAIKQYAPGTGLPESESLVPATAALNSTYQRAPSSAPPTSREQMLRDPAFLSKTPEQQKILLDTVKFAEGGPIGYAQGGAIQNPAQDPMQQVHPLVSEYRRYAVMAQQMGATPVSFEDFGALRQAAVAQQNQPQSPYGGAVAQQNQPQSFSDGGAVWNDQPVDGYADGGGVAGWLREKFMPQTTAAIRGDNLQRQIDQQTAPQRVAPVPPNQPPAEVHSSDPETEALLRKYKNVGYASGGAIPVGGNQVLGPGDGKSDSIPAVIDGHRPAALSTGEFVMPVETVRHFGMDRLRKMVEASRKPQGN